MRFRRWLARGLACVALWSLVASLPLLAQVTRLTPSRLQRIQQPNSVGEALPSIAKGMEQRAMTSFGNTESAYLDPAFWDAPPSGEGTVHLDWPGDWGLRDRRGDTRLKGAKVLWWQSPDNDDLGSDHLFIRFDLQRVVTSAPDFTCQGHLSNATYAQMVDGGLLSGKTTIKIQMGIAYEKPDIVMVEYPYREEVHLHNLTYDVMILDVNGVPVNILIPGLKYGDFAPTMKLTVPTSSLRFPVKDGSEPTPAWNVVHFKLIPPKVTVLGWDWVLQDGQVQDVHRHPVDIPATFFSYNLYLDAELSFGAIAPIMLVHGTNANPKTWNVPKGNSFNDYFSTFLGTYFNDIALQPNGAIDSNGKMLESQMVSRLLSVGAKRCHIIAHSKGGLDSRAFIKAHYEGGLNINLDQSGHFEVLSLYTLNTPHRGTVLADISWNHLNNPNIFSDPHWRDLWVVMNYDFAFLHSPPADDPDGEAWAPSGSALMAQMTINMEEWNNGNQFDFSKANTNNRPICFYNTASDADNHIRNLSIDSVERKYSGIPFDDVATSMYRMLYWAKRVQTRSSTRSMGAVTIPVTEMFVPDDQRGSDWNEMVASISSEVYDGGTLFCPVYINNLGGIILSNHSSVKTSPLAGGIVDQIHSDWPLEQ